MTPATTIPKTGLLAICLAVSACVSTPPPQSAAEILTASMPCGTPLPYSADEFLRKLLSLADNGIGSTLPKRFEEVFSVRLVGTMFEGGMRVGSVIVKDGARSCDWYASVFMSTFVHGKMGVAVQADIGAVNFAGGDSACLRPELLKEMLQTDGWTNGGNAGFETVVYKYLKPDAEIYATPIGTISGHSCIRDIRLVVKQSDE